MSSQANSVAFIDSLAPENHLPFSDKWFIGAVCVLTAIPTLKLGLIEPLEIFFLIHICLLLIRFAAGNFALGISRIWIFYGIPHTLFVFAAFFLSILALRQAFFPVPTETSILKQPFFITIARLVEYLLVVFYMLYSADLLRRKKEALIFALRAYVFAGVAASVYGLVSLPISIATGITYLGAAANDNRVSGSFNEGGPFGLYLVSVLLCLILLYSRKELQAIWFILLSCILIITIALSQSKAAFSSIALMILAIILFGKSFRVKLGLLVLLAALVAGVIATPKVYMSLMGYLTAATDSTTGLLDDSTYGFGGRAAAAVLVPRIIAAHPLAGVGLGNYQLVRNDPAYLQGIPPLMHWDYSGAGLFVKIAELGVPLSLFLVGTLLLPLRTAIKKRSDMLLKVFASFQVIATFQGVELHFFYPWLSSAFVLAALHFMPVSTAETSRPN